MEDQIRNIYATTVRESETQLLAVESEQADSRWSFSNCRGVKVTTLAFTYFKDVAVRESETQLLAVESEQADSRWSFSNCRGVKVTTLAFTYFKDVAGDSNRLTQLGSYDLYEKLEVRLGRTTKSLMRLGETVGTNAQESKMQY
ncbi:Hypothetical protein CINCED_3A001782 [Cinara cedri]|uniref:Uncharacterized protein n=1 Tax=Cinara cedri TaxID=506608 RepID=A0A5E4NB28_9HEMI|nr:Hypothetical protein CINCED_3A001782 [Cinara cedri]